jgi:hypothetical protein
MSIITKHTDNYECDCGKSWHLKGAKGKGSERNSIYQIIKLHKRVCDLCSWGDTTGIKVNVTINTGRGQGNPDNAPLGTQLDKISDNLRIGDTTILKKYKNATIHSNLPVSLL